MQLSIHSLLGVPIFKDLKDGELEEILSAAVQRKVPAETYIFYQEDPAGNMYLMERGKVKISQTAPDGQQVILHILDSGQVFGLGAFSPGMVYPGDALTLEECSLLVWDHEALVRLTLRHPQLALNALKWMAGRVHELQERVRELSTERVERRLARLLLRLVRQSGRKVDQGVLIDLPVSRQDLAEMSGTTLYTVSRIISQWERDEIVDAGRERVVVRFPHGLVRIAEDLPAPPEKESP